MRVLHLAYSLGEYSAGTRIAESLPNNVNNYFFLGRPSKYKAVRDKQVFKAFGTMFGVFFHVVDLFFSKIFKVNKGEVFSFGLFYVIQSIVVRAIVMIYKIDKVHIHWGGYSFFPVESVCFINKPVIITAHDFNYFTGGCHVPMSCEGFLSNCKECPLLGKGKAISNFLKVRRFKALKSHKDKISVVCPSSYVLNMIKSVYPFLNASVIHNPLGLEYIKNDLSVSFDKYFSRLQERKGKVKILVVSVFDSDRDNKGFFVVKELLNKIVCEGLGDKIDITCIAGSEHALQADYLPTYVNFCSSESLVTHYESSDLCIVPSKFETFSQVTLESISMGTPVVCFDSSGPNDIVFPNRTGFLVTAFDSKDFIAKVLENVFFKRLNKSEIYKNCSKAREQFSPTFIASKYCEIYDK